MASPLFANVYLHKVFDLWANRWRCREAKRKVIISRNADDIVVGFEYEVDARRFWDAMHTARDKQEHRRHVSFDQLIDFPELSGRAKRSRRKASRQHRIEGQRSRTQHNEPRE